MSGVEYEQLTSIPSVIKKLGYHRYCGYVTSDVNKHHSLGGVIIPKNKYTKYPHHKE